ncbi:MAG: DUF4244 domain-containing protein [Propionibacteriaceae bacterium]|jgi:hypothetical protein|nr:DUF4244 domain-containing protein [Propionibacteriaceae bacterium]
MSNIKARLNELVPVRFGWVQPLRQRGERGMATAEYAVGILAAVAIALVLLTVFKSGGTTGLVTSLIAKIFSAILSFI